MNLPDLILLGFIPLFIFRKIKKIINKRKKIVLNYWKKIAIANIDAAIIIEIGIK